MIPSVDQIGGIVRALVAIFGGMALQQGIVSQTNLEMIGGGIMSLAVILYTIYHNRRSRVVNPETGRAKSKD